MRFNIEGEPMPVVVCELESGEMMITEKGAMSWMSPNMQMNTVGGGIGKIFGRMVSGESMFVNTYTAMNGQGTIAFASSFPGCIRAFEIQPGSDIVCQKSAFLASTSGVELSVFFQKRVGAGFFGGADAGGPDRDNVAHDGLNFRVNFLHIDSPLNPLPCSGKSP